MGRHRSSSGQIRPVKPGDTTCRPESIGWTQSFRWRRLLVCALVLLGGCSSGLPNYAAPKIAVIDKDLDMTDVIRYRKLDRADFKGTQPPAGFDQRMAAVTCVYTQPLVDKKAIDIQPATAADGRQVYDVTYANLRFRALMNRNCSWWNPATPDSDRDYVLEHEQIHFALFEIAAREWSELPPIRLRVKADGNEAMKREIQAQFEGILQQRLAVLRAQNVRFDEETSLGHNPEKQREWLERVRSKIQPGSESAESQAYRLIVETSQ